jgi:hypothetical protein
MPLACLLLCCAGSRRRSHRACREHMPRPVTSANDFCCLAFGCYPSRPALRPVRELVIIVSKRPGSPYRAGRSAHWLEIKTRRRSAPGSWAGTLETLHRTNRFDVITGGAA